MAQRYYMRSMAFELSGRKADADAAMEALKTELEERFRAASAPIMAELASIKAEQEALFGPDVGTYTSYASAFSSRSLVIQHTAATSIVETTQPSLHLRAGALVLVKSVATQTQ